MRFDQSNTDYVNVGTISDGLEIAAAGVTVANAESGRITGGLRFSVGGSAFVNLAGGIVRLSNGDAAAVTVVIGSDGADTLTNGGRITGGVALGGGADEFTWTRDGLVIGTVDLGDGDDVFRASDPNASGMVLGGGGYDRYELLGGYSGFIEASGFESLHFAGSGKVGGVSGLLAVTMAAGTRAELERSNSPTATVTLTGGEFQLGIDGVVGAIAGSAGDDGLRLSLRSRFDSAYLGAGADLLSTAAVTLSRQAGSPIGTVADGGDGFDGILLGVLDGTPEINERYDIELAQFRNFEELIFGNALVQFNGRVSFGNLTLVGATAAQSFRALATGDRNRIEIDASNDHAAFGSAVVMVGSRATLVIGGTLTRAAAVGSITTATSNSASASADDSLSVTIVNRGAIAGDAGLGIGDDVYDGSAGSVGGTIFGNAGNDTLIGGAGVERLEGGFGADTLFGGAGDDSLVGNNGNDILNGGMGMDMLSGGAGLDVFHGTFAELAGDVIADFERGDAIRIADAALGTFSFVQMGDMLDFGDGRQLAVNGLGGRLKAQAAPSGGVELAHAEAVRGDINGDGRADVLWRNDNGALTNWLGRADGGFSGNDQAAFHNVPRSLKVAGVADFNGDGRNDILWRGADGALTNWLGRADGGFTGNDQAAFHKVPVAWKVAGAGDFNGDGRDDVLWRHDNGALTNWLGGADGGFTGNDAAASFAGIPTSLKVAALADFNGDGRDDILWRHDNGALTNWLGRADGGFSGNDAAAFHNVPTSWKVAGAGDFNGDGRDDISWRNDNGAMTNWLGRADGGFLGNDQAAFHNVPTSLKVAGVADYNGDGRDDILWRHDNGALTNWLGTPDGGFLGNDGAAFHNVPTSWQTQMDGILII